MVAKLSKDDLIDINGFNKDTLKKLKPYFDIDTTMDHAEDHYEWHYNLLVLAKHNLSIAHCIQHNHGPRAIMAEKFKNKNYPDFYDPTFENTMGCYSNFKSADSMILQDRTVTGTKQWISMVDQADYGIFIVPHNGHDQEEAYVLIDFAEVNPLIDLSYVTPLGMQIAHPGSITIDNCELPEEYILGYRKYFEPTIIYFRAKNDTDYAFITNYLGLVTALFEDLRAYIEQTKINVEFELNKLELAVAALNMVWHNNLPSVRRTTDSPDFWRQRNTQYTMSKTVLLDLIHFALQIFDARWTDISSPSTQRFRDAITFCSHMKPLYRNVDEKHFVQF